MCICRPPAPLPYRPLSAGPILHRHSSSRQLNASQSNLPDVSHLKVPMNRSATPNIPMTSSTDKKSNKVNFFYLNFSLSLFCFVFFSSLLLLFKLCNKFDDTQNQTRIMEYILAQQIYLKLNTVTDDNKSN